MSTEPSDISSRGIDTVFTAMELCVAASGCMRKRESTKKNQKGYRSDVPREQVYL